MIEALRRVILWVAGLIGGAAVLALMLLTLADAVMRTLGRPILGANEITEVLLLVVVAAAIPISIVSGKAIAIEGPVARLPSRIAGVIVFLGMLLSAALMAFLAYHSFRTSADARDFGERSAILHIPHDVLYVALSVGAGSAALAFVLYWLIERSADDHGAETSETGPDP
ncbi:MAG: TRAP transporter small permease subunit [Pseudomonadota bacterium]